MQQMQRRTTRPRPFPALARVFRDGPELQWVDTRTLEEIWARKFHTTGRYCELIHVIEGKARIECQGRPSFQVGPGDTFVIPRHVIHRDVFAAQSGYRVIYVFFRWPGRDAMVRVLDPEVLCATPAGAKVHLHWLFKQMEEEHERDTIHAQERMQLILGEILSCLIRYGTVSRNGVSEARHLLAVDRQRTLAHAVHEYLVAHCDKSVTLDQLSESHDISPFHLSRIFARHLGMSISDALTLARIDRAKTLLAQRELSVKEVAPRAGFTDSNYFAKVFRKITGQSPSEYRVAKLAARTRH
jgi:AraC-like DNA-binding protein